MVKERKVARAKARRARYEKARNVLRNNFGRRYRGVVLSQGQADRVVKILAKLK